jgi:hypothetical protein
MRARAQKKRDEVELTFKPELTQFKFRKDPSKNTDTFMERMEKYEEKRKLRMAKLQRKAWVKEMQSMVKEESLSTGRSSEILAKSKSTGKKQPEGGTAGRPDHNAVDLKTGQALFQPSLDSHSVEIVQNAPLDRYGTGSTDVGESLYRNAFNRRLRKMLAQRRIEEHEEQVRTRSKSNRKTMEIMRKALTRDIGIAFQASVGMRDFDEEALAESMSAGASGSPQGSPFASPFEETEDELSSLLDSQELLQTLYLLNFLPTFVTAKRGGERKGAPKNSAGGPGEPEEDGAALTDTDHMFVARLWNLLAVTDPGAKASSPSRATAFRISIASLQSFLARAIFPSPKDGVLKADVAPPPPPPQASPSSPKSPTIVVSIELGETDDDSETEGAGPPPPPPPQQQQQQQHSPSNDTVDRNTSGEGRGGQRAHYISMLREFRVLYKKIMPSGYRTLESRESAANAGGTKLQVSKKTRRKLHSLEEKELEECTFRPKINTRSRKLAAAESRKTGAAVGFRDQPSEDDGDGPVPRSHPAPFPASKRREDLLLHKHKISKGKQALARKQRIEKEVKECTFQPDTSRSKHSLNSGKKKKKRTPSYTGSDRTIRAGNRLCYSNNNSSAKKKGRDGLDESALTTEEREYLKHCTFTPTKYSKSPHKSTGARVGSSGRSSRRDVWSAPSSQLTSHAAHRNQTPKAYEQAITRMRQAHARRIETKRAEAVYGELRSGHRISPVKDLHEGLHRNAHGKIISKPFEFCTSKRAKNRLKSSKKDLGHSPVRESQRTESRGTAMESSVEARSAASSNHPPSVRFTL